MSNILITGATGFVGKHLLPELLKIKELKVLAIVRDKAKAKQMFGDDCAYATIEESEIIVGFNPNIIIHLASMLTSSNDASIVNDIVTSNITFGIKLLNMLNQCTDINLFINTGSFASYRLGVDKVNDAYLYSATKTAFTAFLDYYSNLYGMPYVNIIPYTIYGGADNKKKIIDYVYDSFSAVSPVKMTLGQQVLDFIHIYDVVSFYKFIILNCHKVTSKETYYLGTGKGTSIKELTSIMETVFKKKANIDWGALNYRDMDVMYAVAPIQKILSLGWKPSIELSDFITNSIK